jgi:uncharacterized protein (TIGR02118 family)
MIKVIGVVRRKAGLPVIDFQTYWRNIHAIHVRRLPGLRRYVQSHTILSGYRGRTPVFDGVAELWFDDTDALRALGPGAELAAVRSDSAEFVDPDSYNEFITEDVVIKDGNVPANCVKNVEFVKKKPAMSPQAFHEYWIGIHGPLGSSIPQVRRYVQSHTRAEAYSADRVPPFDGLALTWFDDTTAMRAAAATPEYAQTRGDEENFVSVPLDFIITTEHIIVA